MPEDEIEPVFEPNTPNERLNSICEDILEITPLADKKYVALKLRALVDGVYTEGIEITCEAVRLGLGFDEELVQNQLPRVKKMLTEDPLHNRISQRLPHLKRILTAPD